MRSVADGQKDKYEHVMGTLGIVLSSGDKNVTGKPLIKRTGRFASMPRKTLLAMLMTKLPSPNVAQKYRV